MANVKVSELPAASAASTSQEFEVNDSGTSKKVTGSQIKSFVKDGLVLTDITDVTASITELNYVDGVTSSVQDQLNDKFKQRTITGTTDQITVTNGDGVAGNPTIAPVIASQAAAEAGTGVGLMTSERVAQAIDAQVPSPESMTLLGTLNTTSGNTQTISGLNLNPYRILRIRMRNVVRSGSTSSYILQSGGIELNGPFNTLRVTYDFWLDTGFPVVGAGSVTLNSGATYRNSTTSLTFQLTANSFNGGSIEIYGVN